jgi:[CysO sulfur-carrier protein]-S-L-cysteine hydrolase
MLKITRDVIDDIIEHGRSEAPLEACGYLAAKNGLICKRIPMTNIDASPVHYSMDPKEQFAAVRNCRETGLTIRAVYHTHPETEAYPSVEDINLAYDPNISYVIVSLTGSTPSIHAFIIKNKKIREEQLEIIGE